MSKMIFCTFEGPDFADLAMGRIKASISGIKSVYQVPQTAEEPYQPDSFGPYQPVYTGGLGGYDAYTDSTAEPLPMRPVTMRIVCEEHCHQEVVAMLVSMYANKIVTTD